MRAVLRFVPMRFRALTSADGHPPVHSAMCAMCKDESPGYATTDLVERWTMHHASQAEARGQEHRVFRMLIQSHAVAEPAA